MTWLYMTWQRVGHMDRTETLVAMSAAMVLGFICMRGLSSRVR